MPPWPDGAAAARHDAEQSSEGIRELYEALKQGLDDEVSGEPGLLVRDGSPEEPVTAPSLIGRVAALLGLVDIGWFRARISVGIWWGWRRQALRRLWARARSGSHLDGDEQGPAG